MNKYLRNRHFKNKAWNRAKRIEGEFSFKHYCRTAESWISPSSYEEQVENQRNIIRDLANCFINGTQMGERNAPGYWKRIIRKRERARLKSSLIQVINNEDDCALHKSKKDVNYNWF